MKKFFTAIFTVAAIILTAAPVGFEHRNCSSGLVVENNTVRLKKSNELVGFIRDNHVYTRYPFRVPELAHNAVNEFINRMNGFIRQDGRYFLDEDGSCGFVEPISSGMSDEEALKKLWNRKQIYKLAPEFIRLCNSNVPVEFALHTVKAFPLELRTPATLDDIHEVSGYFRRDLAGDMPGREFRLKSVRFKPLDFNAGSVDENTADLRKKIKDALYYAGSIDLAMIYCQLGAVKGDAYAQYRLAWLMEEKLEQDEAVIFDLYDRAAANGCSEAVPYLARCYWFGTGVAVDRRKAFELANEHLKHDPSNLHARLLTGLWYFYETAEKEKGYKIIKDCWYKDFMPASLEIGLIHEFGLGGHPQEVKLACCFIPVVPQTVHFWINGYMLNARDRERWFKCGGGDY